MATFTTSKENFGIPPRIPPGLASVVESLARQVIKNRPKDVYAFAADHFENLLKMQQQQQQQEPRQKYNKNLNFTQVKENVIKTLATSTSIKDLQKKNYIPQVQAIIDNSGPIIHEKLEALKKIRMQENNLEAQLNETCNLLQDVSACFSRSTRGRPLSADAATNTVYRSAIGLEAMLNETRNLLVDISSNFVQNKTCTLPALVPASTKPSPRVSLSQDESTCTLPLLNISPATASPKSMEIKENIPTLPQLLPNNDETYLILPPETPENIPETVTMVIIPDSSPFGETVEISNHEMQHLQLLEQPHLQCINEESENGPESIDSSSSAKETTATDGPIATEMPSISTTISLVDNIVVESSNEAKETTITDGMSDDTDRPFVPELNLDSLQDQTISSFKLTNDEDEASAATSQCTTKRCTSAENSIIAAITVLQAGIRGFLVRRRLANKQSTALVSKKRLYRENAMQQNTTTSIERYSLDTGNSVGLMHTGEFHDCIPLSLHLSMTEMLNFLMLANNDNNDNHSSGVIIEEIVQGRNESPVTMMQIVPAPNDSSTDSNVSQEEPNQQE